MEMSIKNPPTLRVQRQGSSERITHANKIIIPYPSGFCKGVREIV